MRDMFEIIGYLINELKSRRDELTKLPSTGSVRRNQLIYEINRLEAARWELEKPAENDFA